MHGSKHSQFVKIGLHNNGDTSTNVLKVSNQLTLKVGIPPCVIHVELL